MKLPLLFVFSFLLLFSCTKNGKFPDNLPIEKGNIIHFNKQSISDSLINVYANFLRTEGFFNQTPQTIAIEVVTQPSKMFKFYIVDKLGLHQKPESIVDAKVLARTLSSEIFEDELVEIIFSDEQFQPIKTLEPEKSIGHRVKLEGNDVIYNSSFTMEGAYIVANYLKDYGFFKPNGGQSVMVEISQRGRMNFYIITDDSFAMNEEKFKETQKFGAIISHAIYSDKPVDVVYTNRLLTPRPNGIVFFNPATAVAVKDPNAKKEFEKVNKNPNN